MEKRHKARKVGDRKKWKKHFLSLRKYKAEWKMMKRWWN